MSMRLVRAALAWMTSAVLLTASPSWSAPPGPKSAPKPEASSRPSGSSVLASLPKLPRPAWLGVTMKRAPQGVSVEHVVRGSPAEKGGLRVGDRIVTVAGNGVSEPAEVTHHVASLSPGSRVSLSISRGAEAKDVSLELVARPSMDEILRMDLVGAVAPPWPGTKPLAGAPSSLAELRGRVVIVDFWASFCGPCRMLAPRLSALKDRFGAQGLRVVGITTDSAEKAATFAEEVQMRYPIVVDDQGETAGAYGISSLPTMLLVDKRGVIRDVFIGFDPSGEGELASKIKELLAEPTDAANKPSIPSPAPESSAVRTVR